MKTEDPSKAWSVAAFISGVITGSLLIYVAIVETVVRFLDFTPPMDAAAAAAVKYGLYFSGAASVFAVKYIKPFLEARKTALSVPGLMLAQSAATAALCEFPALAGLMIFFLTGGYWDFYLLTAFSAVMEAVHFPRRRAWEERARNRRALIPE